MQWRCTRSLREFDRRFANWVLYIRKQALTDHNNPTLFNSHLNNIFISRQWDAAQLSSPRHIMCRSACLASFERWRGVAYLTTKIRKNEKNVQTVFVMFARGCTGVSLFLRSHKTESLPQFSANSPEEDRERKTEETRWQHIFLSGVWSPAFGRCPLCSCYYMFLPLSDIFSQSEIGDSKYVCK